jgi:hypothetical protein
MMFRIFFFGFAFTLFFMAVLGGPRRGMLVDEYGRPVDIHGRPIDRYGNPIVYQNYAPIYDPYNLAGSSKNSYPYQTMYGRQYTSGAPQQPNQPQQNTQNYY